MRNADSGGFRISGSSLWFTAGVTETPVEFTESILDSENTPSLSQKTQREISQTNEERLSRISGSMSSMNHDSAEETRLFPGHSRHISVISFLQSNTSVTQNHFTETIFVTKSL